MSIDISQCEDAEQLSAPASQHRKKNLKAYSGHGRLLVKIKHCTSYTKLHPQFYTSAIVNHYIAWTLSSKKAGISNVI